MSTALPVRPVRIVLADLPRLTRDLISRTFEDEPMIDVVCEVTDVTSPVRELVDETDADIVIVGAQAPALLAECRELLHEDAPLRVLAVSGDGREAHLYGLRPYEVVVSEFSCDSVLELARNSALHTRKANRAVVGGGNSTTRKVGR
jgi:DNA-binding NarL/FixJ family response regulator